METESRTHATVAQKDLREISFDNKISKEGSLQVNIVKMNGAHKVNRQHSAAKQSTRCEPS